MFKTNFAFALLICFAANGAVVALAQSDLVQDDKFSDQQLEFFENQVRPLLVKHCYECHGPDSDELGGGLSLASRKDILKGGDTGPAIVPKDAKESLLIDSINYGDLYEMPPDSKLPKKDIATLTKWVEMGAPWPKASDIARAHGNEFNLKERIAEHWCWQSTTNPSIPKTKTTDWAKQPLDQFVLHKLESKNLMPAQPAERRVLIRRAYFDLIGLPPTPEQINSFVHDKSPDAFAKVVDGLLASPHFGERWARHWMDLMRYAETCGHEFDYPLPHAHEYRDYLIRAFNSDVAYDQFIIEHIAGDLISKPRRHLTEKYNESVLGTGFWYLGEATHGPVDVKGDEAGRIDNQIDVMTKSFLGLTVACARCHDHKFDAISTKDYYALSGFLQSSRRQEVMLDVGGRISKAKKEAAEITSAADAALAEFLWSQVQRPQEKLEDYLYAAALVYGDSPANLRIDDVMIEGEKLKVVEATGGKFQNQQINPQRGFKWNGNHQAWWRDGKVGDQWKMELPLSRAGEYEVFVDLTKARDYGIVEILIDDQKLGGPIDLYDPQLSKTNRISLGKHQLSDGVRSLVFKIVGANKKAIPARMVGIDYILLRPIGQTDESKSPYTAKSAAGKFGLDEEKLKRWVKLLMAAETQRHSHPLNVVARAAANREKIDRGYLAALGRELSQRSEQAKNNRKKAKLFADFNSKVPDGWFFTGEAFDRKNTKHNSFDPVSNANSISMSGTASSARFGKKFHGVLRSPTFTIEHRNVHYRLNSKDVQIRLIIDGFEMDKYNALLFNGMTFKHNTDGVFEWKTQSGDLKNHLGHRAYIEIIDHSDGFVALDEIWFSDGPAPGDPSSKIAATAGHDASSLRELCNATAKQIAQASNALELDSLDRYYLFNMTLQTADDSRLAAIQQARQQIQAINPPRPRLAVGMTDGTGENEFVFVRGNHKSLGALAPRQLISALVNHSEPEKYHGSGRMALARKIASPDNPLTARVAVNRIWHHLTGQGIVASVDNFGVLGKAPSHPALLDHLANEFVRENWSVKKMIRKIMLSSTYQMASTTNPANSATVSTVDPDNNLLHKGRVRRLQGEVIRDSLLMISGRLDRKMYGRSVAIHLTPFMQGRGRPGRSGPLDGNGRRSVYVEVRRNFLSPMMLAFDTPIPFNSIGRRNVSNVPAQALIMMNNPLVLEMADRWAKELVKKEITSAERISEIYESALGRMPTDNEMKLATQFLEQQANEYKIELSQLGSEPRPWRDLCHVVFNVKEFIYLK